MAAEVVGYEVLTRNPADQKVKALMLYGAEFTVLKIFAENDALIAHAYRRGASPCQSSAAVAISLNRRSASGVFVTISSMQPSRGLAST